MADDTFSSIAQGMQAGNQAYSSGQQWAQNAFGLQLKKQEVQQQYDQHQLMQKQFTTNTYGNLIDRMSNVATMAKGPVKDSHIDQLRDFAEQAQLPVDDTWFASLKDETYQPKWSALGKAMGFSDQQSDSFHQYMESARSVLGQPAMLDVMDHAIQGFSSIEAGKMRAAGYAAMAAPKIAGAENSIQTSVLAPMKAHLENFTSVMNKVQQLNDPKITNSNLKDILESLSVANAGMGRQAISDAKLKMIIPNLGGTKIADLEQFLGNNGEQKANPALVDYTKNLTNSMLPALESQMKSIARTQGQSKKFSSQFGNDAVQSSVRPYVSGDFFRQSAQEYFPNGKPAWLKYNPGGSGQPTAKAPATEAPTANNEPAKLDQKAALQKYGTQVDIYKKMAALGVSRDQVKAKTQAMQLPFHDDLADFAGIK